MIVCVYLISQSLTFIGTDLDKRASGPLILHHQGVYLLFWVDCFRLLQPPVFTQIIDQSWLLSRQILLLVFRGSCWDQLIVEVVVVPLLKLLIVFRTLQLLQNTFGLALVLVLEFHSPTHHNSCVLFWVDFQRNRSWSWVRSLPKQHPCALCKILFWHRPFVHL